MAQTPMLLSHASARGLALLKPAGDAYGNDLDLGYVANPVLAKTCFTEAST